MVLIKGIIPDFLIIFIISPSFFEGELICAEQPLQASTPFISKLSLTEIGTPYKAGKFKSFFPLFLNKYSSFSFASFIASSNKITVCSSNS